MTTADQTVLVVGHSSTSVQYMAGVLTRAGFDVSVSTEPRRVVCQIDSSQPQLVVIDVDRASSRLVGQVRAADADVGVLVIASTDDPQEVSAFFDLGADGHLPPDSSNAVLVARARAVLRNTARGPRRFKTVLKNHQQQSGHTTGEAGEASTWR